LGGVFLDFPPPPPFRAPIKKNPPPRAPPPARGSVCDDLVEAIDLAPTFIEFAGGEVPGHIVEGRSLMAILHGRANETWRDYVISEYDYSISPMAAKLGIEPREARLFMVADKSWKFMHAEGGFAPMLFDLTNDPDELVDLGTDPAHAQVIEKMYERLGSWARRPSQRITLSDADIKGMRGRSRRKGIVLGVFDGSEIDAELTAKYRGKAPLLPTDVKSETPKS
jgi:hypothetical protein